MPQASPAPAPPAPRTIRVKKLPRVAAFSIAGAVAIAAVATALASGPSGPGPEFVQRDGDHLVLDGQPFSFASTNTYELMFGSPATVDSYFTRMNDMGLDVLRTWAFFDIGQLDGTMGVEIANKGTYFQYFDPELGRPVYNDGANGLEKLDYVIYSAQEHGIKLILPLVNNWTNFGGMDQYVMWAGGTWHDDFITNPTIKGWYKDWVSHLLNRVNSITGVAYKDDPTIMTWELANEMRCSESGAFLSSADCLSSAMVDWVDEMSTYVKSIDHNHLVAFGSEGFLCDKQGSADWLTNCGETADPVAVTNLPNIDMNGIHLYPDHWDPTSPTDDWADWGSWWIERHAEIADEAGKPFYIGEFGWRGKTTRLAVFDQWLATFFEQGGDGATFWMMQPTNPGFTALDNDGFVVYCPGPVCQLVSNWNQHVQNAADWNTFGPVGDGDFHTTAPNESVSFAITDNDMAFGETTLDLSSIDLDQATSGVQSTLSVDNGTYSVVDGILTFVPATDAIGSARLEYTVADSEGRTTLPIRVSVVIVEGGSESAAP